MCPLVQVTFPLQCTAGRGGKHGLTAVRMEKNTIGMNNNIRINPVLRVLTAVNLLLPHPVCESLYSGCVCGRGGVTRLVKTILYYYEN